MQMSADALRDHRGFGVTQRHGMRDDGIEHRLRVIGCGADQVQDLIDGRLLSTRFVEFARQVGISGRAGIAHRFCLRVGVARRGSGVRHVGVKANHGNGSCRQVGAVKLGVGRLATDASDHRWHDKHRGRFDSWNAGREAARPTPAARAMRPDQ